MTGRGRRACGGEGRIGPVFIVDMINNYAFVICFFSENINSFSLAAANRKGLRIFVGEFRNYIHACCVQLAIDQVLDGPHIQGAHQTFGDHTMFPAKSRKLPTLVIEWEKVYSTSTTGISGWFEI